MAAKEKLFSITKKDFREDVFRAGGKGGQKQNKTSSGVRLTHLASGAVGESRQHREQHQNRKEAFRKCIESDKFNLWLKKKIAEESLSKDEKRRKEEEIARAVDKAMHEDNIVVEVKDEDGKWVKLKQKN